MYAKHIYDGLIRNNVQNMFIYSGGAIMSLIDKIDNKINYYINNHEQNCGHAATGYAKSTGQTGVCIVTSGPGLTNMITPMLDATNDSTPLLVLSGQVATNTIGTNAFQECDAVNISKGVTKWSYLVKKNDDPISLIDYAFKIANDGKKGTVHLDFPKDVLTSINEECKKINTFNLNKTNIFNHNYNYKNIADIINASDRPILYVGQGCNDSSDLLRVLAIKGNIPVTTTMHAMGSFDEYNELSLKFLGMHGNPAANYAIQNADTIIALGSRFDDRTTGNIKKYAPKVKTIIHVNIEQNEINKVIKAHYPLNICCSIFCNKIIPYISYNKRSEWFNQINQWKENMPIRYDKSKKLKTQLVIEKINKHLKFLNKHYIITTGVGNHQMMACQYINWTQPKTFISSGSLGVMGVGLPYAIGAQIGNPNKLVLDIDGDGSFNHTLGDLQTVSRYNLPIKIAIMNDSSLSMVRAWEELFFKKNYVATDLPTNPNYSTLAKAYGIKSLICDNINDLDDVIFEMLNYKNAILVDFKVEKDLCMPLVPPGNGLDEMMFYHTIQNINNVSAPS